MLIAKYSEPLLKGRATRIKLEQILINNIKNGIRCKIQKDGGVLFIESDEEEKSASSLCKIFGINYVLRCDVVDSNLEEISRKCVEIAKKFPFHSSFAIRARRVGEHGFKSRDVGVKCGADIQKNRKLFVNLTSPDNEIFVEIRKNKAYVSTEVKRGVGGLPLGSSGKMVLLLSNVHSLIGGWMMMKRGCQLILLQNKYKNGVEVLKNWSIGKKLKIYKLNFHSELLERVQSKFFSCKNLIEIANEIAEEEGAYGIIYGENQLQNLLILNRLSKIPIYSPILCLNKNEIENIWKRIFGE